MYQLSRDMIRAKALGYGCHYGKYKADHPGDVITKQEPVKSERTKVCKNCGQEFSLENRNANALYCSDYCYNAFNANRAAQRARDRKGITGEEVRTCPQCGKQYRLGNRHALCKYCSEECKIKAGRARYCGRRRAQHAKTMGE